MEIRTIKTAREWAAYLPADIGWWFVEEVRRRDPARLDDEYGTLGEAVDDCISWDKTEFGRDFWKGVCDLAGDYAFNESQILRPTSELASLLNAGMAAGLSVVEKTSTGGLLVGYVAVPMGSRSSSDAVSPTMDAVDLMHWLHGYVTATKRNIVSRKVVKAKGVGSNATDDDYRW